MTTGRTQKSGGSVSYRIGKLLGAGGMAETYVAEQVLEGGLTRRVAIKRILKPFELDQDFLRQFGNEARLSLHLQHANIVTVLDVGSFEGRSHIVMELVDGLDLRQFLRRLAQPMPLELALYLAVQLAHALDYAHTLELEGKPACIVHRDVSPSNVLVGLRGEVKLADFGIARAATAGHVTKSGVIQGKSAYMSPEQTHGARDLDARSDLFSLGIVLFEALTGKRPFDGASELDTLLNINKGQRTSDLRALAPHAPDSFCAMIDALLEPDRAKRTQSAALLIDELSAVHIPTNAARRLGQLVGQLRPTEPTDAPSVAAQTAPSPPPHGTQLQPDAIWVAPAPPAQLASPTDPTHTAAPARAPIAVGLAVQPTAALASREPADVPSSAGAATAPGRKRSQPEAATDRLETPPTFDPPSDAYVVEAAIPAVDSPADEAGASTGDSQPIPPNPPNVGRGLVPRRAFMAVSIAIAASLAIAVVVVFAGSRGGPDDAARTSSPTPVPAHPADTAAIRSDARALPRVDAAVQPAADTVAAALRDAGVAANALPSPQPSFHDRAEGAGLVIPDAGTDSLDASQALAVLRITTVPWGTVWIDGVRAGEGRVRAQVTAGRHMVAAGGTRPGPARAVDLEAGGQRSLVLRWSGM